MVLGRTNQGALFQRSSIATLLLNLEPWSSGYGWRLMFQRSWVRMPAPYTGWAFFTLICCKICIVCLKKAENKRKRGRSWAILFYLIKIFMTLCQSLMYFFFLQLTEWLLLPGAAAKVLPPVTRLADSQPTSTSTKSGIPESHGRCLKQIWLNRESHNECDQKLEHKNIKHYFLSTQWTKGQ